MFFVFIQFDLKNNCCTFFNLDTFRNIAYKYFIFITIHTYKPKGIHITIKLIINAR